MYFTSLPNHKEMGFDEQVHFSKFKRHNVIFNAISNLSYCERHVGCLSIKTVVSGEEWYNIDNREIAVRPGQFLMLNDDQEYSCRIDGPEKTNIISVFFSKDFSSSVFRDVLCNEDTLLDSPFESIGKAPEFFQTLYNNDIRLQQKLQNLVSSLNDCGYDNHRVDESLTFLLHDLLCAHKVEVHRVGRVSAIKPNTKTEIYKRLCIAKDFMHSTFMHKSDLSLMSHTACLSAPQLIRQFKAVFKTTPHQYLTQIRLAYAARLLKHSTMSVNEITLACGFEDTSAFCRSFKKEYSVSPGSFRKMI
jgi:AraC family transcriptional regulator